MVFDKQLFQRYLEFYDSLGLACIPLYYQDKNPMVKFKKDKTHQDDMSQFDYVKTDISTFEWWKEYNIGVMCGEISGNLMVFDFDHAEAPPPISDTMITRTSRGYHVWLRLENKVGFNVVRKGMEARYNGMFVVAPPSVHPSGHVYMFFKNPRQIRKVPSMEDAFELLGLKPPKYNPSKEVQPAAEGQVPPMPEWMERIWNEPCYEGQRHRFGLIYSSYWARKEPYGRGVKDKNVILEHLERWNRLRCKPPMSERDLPHIVYMALRTPYTFLRNPFEDSV